MNIQHQRQFRLTPLALSILLIAMPTAGFAKTEVEVLREQMKQLLDRIEQLEQKQASNTNTPAQTDQAELSSRIEGVEAAVVEMRKPSAVESALYGVVFGGTFTGVGQHLSSGESAPGTNKGQLNVRGDLEVEIPLGSFSPSGILAGAESKFFGHVRLGQGNGVTPLASTFTASVNSVAFQLASPPDDSSLLLAQAWYQLNVPVGGVNSNRLDGLELTVGKIDPFVFFDNNPIADNESSAFLNNVFVHNPLLDSGADMGVDSYGFSPGVRAAYTFDVNNTNRWTLAVGMFGAGRGAAFENSLTDPFSIVQLQYQGKALMGQPAFVQAYAWNNPQSTAAISGVTESHSGYGISAYQQVSRTVSLFSRIGLSAKGELNFDKAVTAGVQVSGRLWGRNADRVGFAFGALRSSTEYKDAGLGTGSEKNAEIYYAFKANDHLEVTPGIQYISNPAGVQGSPNITVLGLRTTASF